VADNIGGGDVQLAALEAKLDAGDSTFDSQLRKMYMVQFDSQFDRSTNHGLT
jgi:hypothetical protein